MNSITCPACHKPDLKNLEEIDLDLQHSFYAPKNSEIQTILTELAEISDKKYQVYQCKNCKLEFSNPLKAPSFLWYELAYKILNLYPSDRWEFEKVIENLHMDKRVGEIGCGAGSFLKKCQNLNINCHGLDFSNSAIEECKNNELSVSSINLTDAELSDELRRNKQDVICSFHTLEHLDKPEKLFQLAYEWSKEDSTLWISVPSDRRGTRIFNEVDFLDQPPHHITRWSLDSLKAIGVNNRWSLSQVFYEPISLPNSLWFYATRMKVYKYLLKTLNNQNAWLERIIRYSLYPFAFASSLFASNKLKGFSVLAKFSKIN